jgi:hypothetical protein
VTRPPVTRAGGAGGCAMRESEGFITEAVGFAPPFRAVFCYNRNIENKSQSRAVTPLALKLTESFRMSPNFSLTSLKKQSNNALNRSVS